MRRALPPGCVLLLAVACGMRPLEQVETSAPVPVTVEAARVETLRGVIVASATVTPAPGADSIVVAPEAARIVELPKAEGDSVRNGEVLVHFEIPNLPAQVAAREAEVAQATARVETSRSKVNRLNGLLDRGIAARREIEEARQEQAEAEAALVQARSALDAARALADRAIVRARFNGVIAKRWHNPGDLVEASSSDPILRVIDPRHLQVVAAVPLADLPRIAPGRPARVMGPGDREGEAAKVLTKPAQVDPGSATAEIRLAFTGPTRLTAGTAVEVSITAEERQNAVVIPVAALVHDGEQTFVMVVGSDNKAHRREVKTGLTSQALAEVTSGIAAGDQVIVRGQDGLPDGAAVTIAK